MQRELETADAIVLGAGIIGLKSGIALQALGFRVCIVAEKVADQGHQSGTIPDRYLASNFAMASAYPHNLKVERLAEISAASQQVFSGLKDLSATGVSIQKMFEVFESEPEPPPLGLERMNLHTFSGAPHTVHNDYGAPFRPQASHIWGWHFDTYFADMPVYLRWLQHSFFEAGGKLLTARIDRLYIDHHLRNRVVINCLGAGSPDVFGDESPCNIMRGRQILVQDAHPIVDPQSGLSIAYNYTPSPDVYARADGTAEYVHFFSRSDGWVLGQTREPGTLDQTGNWLGKEVVANQISINGISVPEPILELNRQILQASFNTDLPASASLLAREGFRYYRDPGNSGVRLAIDSSTKDSLLLVHNYGHGGSGVTMGWGCALRAASLALEAGAEGHNNGKAALPVHRLLQGAAPTLHVH